MLKTWCRLGVGVGGTRDREMKKKARGRKKESNLGKVRSRGQTMASESGLS